jgi:hypothetical protein
MELKHDGHDLARWMYEHLTGKSYDEYVKCQKEKGFALEAP